MGKIIDSSTENSTLHFAVKVKRLDAAVAREFKQECEEAWGPGVTSVVIDMGGVDFVDSSGIGALLGIYKKLTPGTPSVRLRRVSPPVQSVLELLRLHRIFAIEA